MSSVVSPPVRPGEPGWWCPWPGRTVAVVVIVLVFMVALTAAGAPPLAAAGAVIAAVIVARTGQVPAAAVPGFASR